MKRAVSICSKIGETRELVEQERTSEDDAESANKLDKPHAHRIVISPPDDYSTTAEDPLDRLIEAGKEILTEMGTEFEGGAIVPHLYRSDDDSDDGLHGDDRGFWKNILPNYADEYTPSWSETREKLSLEPHLHCYVVADKMWADTRTIEHQTGWTIHRIEPYGDDDDHRSVKRMSHLVRSVMYSLSHGIRIEDKQMYRYCGKVHNVSAGYQMEAWVDKLARDCAGKVLDMPVSAIKCTEEVEEGDEEAWFSGGNNDGGGGAELEDFIGEQTTVCGGRILHIRNAPRFIGDNDWNDCTERKIKQLHEWWVGDRPPPDFLDGEKIAD